MLSMMTSLKLCMPLLSKNLLNGMNWYFFKVIDKRLIMMLMFHQIEKSERRERGDNKLPPEQFKLPPEQFISPNQTQVQEGLPPTVSSSPDTIPVLTPHTTFFPIQSLALYLLVLNLQTNL